MSWIKRNLFLLIGGLVALGLIGYAGYFSYTQKGRVDEVTGQLNAQTEELKRLTTRDPYPNQGNIDAAREEQKREVQFIDRSRVFFTPVTTLTNIDSAGFKGLLETTIFQMNRDAKEAGVELPAKFDFTFSPQRKRVDFAAETLVPLSTRLAEIKALTSVLFDARVHSITSLRRIPVAKEDDVATEILLGRKSTTNAVTGTISSPYEVIFQGFTTELATVLDGFTRSPHSFIVKNLDVQTNIVTTATTEGAPVYYQSGIPSAAEPRAMSPAELLRSRYGIGGRYGSRPTLTPPPAAATQVTTAPAVRRGPETILDERPLRITMFIEAITLSPSVKAK